MLFYYFLIPLIPTLLWILYFYRKDKFAKEPKKLIFYSIYLGALSTFFVAVFEEILLRYLGLIEFIPTFTLAGLLAMMVVGLVEEVSKLLALRFSFYRSSFFDEISDGIIYAVGIGLGFAFAENIFYALRLGVEVTLVRAAITPIFHAAAAALSGYFLAKGKISGWPPLLKYAGVLLAFPIHGLSNFLLIATSVTGDLTWLFLVILLDLSLVIWLFAGYQKTGKKMPVTVDGEKVSIGASFLTNLVPGFGFLYLNQWNLGFLTMTLVVLFYLSRNFSFFLGPFPGYLLYLFLTAGIFLTWIVSTIVVLRKASIEQKS